ncbi:MAG: hypothetical protein MI919_31305 [Holophagales bacterium]|nr:hypothetical protein [Holophagales bacterium]
MFSLGPRELRYAAFHSGPQGYAFDLEKRIELPEATFMAGALGGPMRDVQGFREHLVQLLGQVGTPVEEASLVLPDSWLRLTFSEITDLPRKADQRQQVLEFKLGRLVPFRVEELRISAVEVTPFPGQEEPRRLLLGFGIEALLAQIESAFDAAGVHIGSITNTTLAMASSLEHTMSAAEISSLIAVYDDSYTLSFYHSAEPMLYRYKDFADGGIHAESVRRDLRMTASFLERHFPEAPFRRPFLSAPAELMDRWLSWTSEELEHPPEPLRMDHFALTRGRAGITWDQVAPLLGAASLEVR